MIERVYLDANALERRWPGGISGDLHILATLSRMVGVQLFIPQSVVYEHQHSTLRRADDALARAKKEIRNVNAMLNRVHAQIPLPEIDRELFTEQFREAVAAGERDYELRISPITTRSIAEFLQAGARHDPPFKDEDRGCRDSVHIASILEHCANVPLSASGEAILLTRDDRLSQRDVANLFRDRGVSLSVQTTYPPVIELVRRRLAAAEQETLAALASRWRPALLAHARENLVPTVAGNTVGVNIGRNVEVSQINEASSDLEPDADVEIAPTNPGTTDSFTASYLLRLRIQGIAERSRALERGGFRLEIFDLHVTLLIAVEARVAAATTGEIQTVSYDSAQAVITFWDDAGNDAEGLPEPTELWRAELPTEEEA